VTPIKTILKNTKNCPHQLDPPPNRTHHTPPYQLSTNEQKVKINKHKKKHEIPTPKTQSLFSFAVFFLLQPTLKLSQHTYTNFQPSRTKNTAQGFVFVSLFDSLLSSLLPFHFGVQNLNPSPKILLYLVFTSKQTLIPLSHFSNKPVFCFFPLYLFNLHNDQNEMRH
jgi:hypothetical protein